MTSKAQPLTWHPGSYTLDYVLRNLPLPQVVQCDHTTCGAGGPKQKLVCGAPLLLYCVRNDAKVLGDLMMEGTKGSKALVENGTQVVIPTEYTGWFCIHDKKGRRKSGYNHNDISKLAESDCHTFLVGGNKSIKVIRTTPAGRERGSVYPGEVLQVDKIARLDKSYLQCTDDRNNDIFIPMATTGHFYVIKNKTKKCKTPVIQIGDLVTEGKVSRIVKLLCGPNVTHSCWIKLTKTTTDPVITTSVVSLGGGYMFGIPKDCNLKFRIANLNDAWRSYSGYKKALRLCERSESEFRRSIKLLRMKNGVTIESVDNQSAPTDIPEQRKDLYFIKMIDPETKRPRQSFQRRSFNLHTEVLWEEEEEDEEEEKHDYEHSWEASDFDDDSEFDDFDDEADDHDYVNLKTENGSWSKKQHYDSNEWTYDGEDHKETLDEIPEVSDDKELSEASSDTKNHDYVNAPDNNVATNKDDGTKQKFNKLRTAWSQYAKEGQQLFPAGSGLENEDSE